MILLSASYRAAVIIIPREGWIASPCQFACACVPLSCQSQTHPAPMYEQIGLRAISASTPFVSYPKESRWPRPQWSFVVAVEPAMDIATLYPLHLGTLPGPRPSNRRRLHQKTTVLLPLCFMRSAILFARGLSSCIYSKVWNLTTECCDQRD